MRVAAWMGCAAIALGLGAPALAQASFQPMKDASLGALYWDAASLTRNGDTFEVDVLQIYRFDANRPLRGTITRHGLSCSWSASTGGMLGSRTVDETGQALETSGPEPFAQPAFYGPHGWQAAIAPDVCDATKAAPTGLSLQDALSDARRRLAAGPVSRANAARALAPPVDIAHARFGLVREDKATGNMAFIDWSRLNRDGDTLTVQTLDVLGDDTPPPPEPQWNYSVAALRTLKLDCQARTLAQTAHFSFTKSLQPEFPDAAAWPVRTAQDWPLGALVLDAACAGREPDTVFGSRAAAIAYQRSLHPLRR